MNAFERGFHDGERAAFSDRKNLKPQRSKPDVKLSPYAEAWWMGYLPQNQAWGERTYRHFGLFPAAIN